MGKEENNMSWIVYLLRILFSLSLFLISWVAGAQLGVFLFHNEPKAQGLMILLAVLGFFVGFGLCQSTWPSIKQKQ